MTDYSSYGGPVEGGYSGVNNPGVECPCRDCIFSGRFGGDSAKRGFLCPYNKRIAFHALGDIKGLIGSLSALIENIGIAAGIEFKGSHGLSDIGEKNGAGPECPGVSYETERRESTPETAIDNAVTRLMTYLAKEMENEPDETAFDYLLRIWFEARMTAKEMKE